MAEGTSRHFLNAEEVANMLYDSENEDVGDEMDETFFQIGDDMDEAFFPGSDDEFGCNEEIVNDESDVLDSSNESR